MANLEGQLGELTGYLKALIPALDRVEERQSQADRKAASAEAKHDAIRAEFNEFKLKVSNRIAELYKKLGEGATANLERKGETEALGKEVYAVTGAIGKEISAIKAKNDGVKQKIWDLLKIVITIILTYGATKLWGK